MSAVNAIGISTSRERENTINEQGFLIRVSATGSPTHIGRLRRSGAEGTPQGLRMKIMKTGTEVANLELSALKPRSEQF